jgi:curved DNA-binding protein CbpA
MRDYYKVLGIKPNASYDTVKSAYRKLVLEYHPDHNSDPKTTEKFLHITEAYSVLKDKSRREQYHTQYKQYQKDSRSGSVTTKQKVTVQGPPPSSSQRQNQSHASTQTEQASTRTTTKERIKSTQTSFAKQGAPSNPKETVEQKTARLKKFLDKAEYQAAEAIAKELIQLQPLDYFAYSVLGDLERIKGNLKEAAKSYVYAAQIAPENIALQQKHTSVIKLIDQLNGKDKTPPIEKEEEKKTRTNLVYLFLLIAMCTYVIFAKEPSLWPDLKPISSWSMGLVTMLLLSGICAGSKLAFSNQGEVESFEEYYSPFARNINNLVKWVSVLCFWLGSMIYLLIGKKTELSSQLISLVTIASIAVSFAASLNPTLNAMQTLFWGANVIYIGAITSYFISKSLKQRTIEEKSGGPSGI